MGMYETGGRRTVGVKEKFKKLDSETAEEIRSVAYEQGVRDGLKYAGMILLAFSTLFFLWRAWGM